MQIQQLNVGPGGWVDTAEGLEGTVTIPATRSSDP
jgi:hypothetical protein